MEILKKEYFFWRQKSRALWLSHGDLNTKYFHNFANHRHAINLIWELERNEGEIISKQADLNKVDFNDFQKLFKDPRNISIADQLDVIQHYPRFSRAEDCRDL